MDDSTGGAQISRFDALQSSGRGRADGSARVEKLLEYPVTQYCDQRHLPLEGRIRLFDEICEIVQAAHCRGAFFNAISAEHIIVLESIGIRLVELRMTPKAGLGDASTLDTAGPPPALWGIRLARAVDLWQLGRVLAEMTRPYSAIGAWSRVIERATTMDENRFLNVASFRLALASFVRGERCEAEFPENRRDAHLQGSSTDLRLTPLPVHRSCE